MHSHRHTPANSLYCCWHEVHKSLIWNWNLPRTPIWSNMKVTRHRPVLLPQRQIILEMYFYKLCTIFYSSLQLSWRWRKYSRQKVSILAVLPTIIKRISDDCVFIIIKLFFNLKKKKKLQKCLLDILYLYHKSQCHSTCLLEISSCGPGSTILRPSTANHAITDQIVHMNIHTHSADWCSVVWFMAIDFVDS